jgi:hypothetical protein
MLWATLELAEWTFGGETGVDFGGSGFGVGITRGLLIGGFQAKAAVTGERFKERRETWLEPFAGKTEAEASRQYGCKSGA